MADKTTGSTEAKPSCRAGKHLVFGLGSEEFALHIRSVQEIIGMQQVTRLPGTPPFVRGVINLRGKVIPVVDLRARFGLPARQQTTKTCIVVVQVGVSDVQTVGFIVDIVTEVIELAEDQLELPPSMGGDLDTDFVVGVGKVSDRVLIVLEAERLLTKGELPSLDVIAEIGEKAAEAAVDG